MRPIGLEAQEIHESNSEGLAQRRQRREGWVSFAALNFADELVAQSSTFGELFLCQPPGLSELPQTVAQPPAKVCHS